MQGQVQTLQPDDAASHTLCSAFRIVSQLRSIVCGTPLWSEREESSTLAWCS